MNIALSIDSYKGVDGSSLSDTRCDQMVKIYEMLEDMNNQITNYVGIQEEAFRRNLFGETEAKSAIRTFFPLLKKLEFVKYDSDFKANTCFTKLGRFFVIASRALKKITDDTVKNEEIKNRLISIKRNAIKQGLVNMSNNKEWEEHNIWIAIYLLNTFRTIDWNEFLYALYLKENKNNEKEIIDHIRSNKNKIKTIVFLNKDNELLSTTCYTYIRGLLTEAGLITKINTNTSIVSVYFDEFYTQIKR